MKYYRFGEYRQLQIVVEDNQTEEEARAIFEQRKHNTKFRVTVAQVSVKSRAYQQTELDKTFISMYKKRGSEYILLNDLHGRYIRYMMSREVYEYAGKGQFLKMLPFRHKTINCVLNKKKTMRKIIYCKNVEELF